MKRETITKAAAVLAAFALLLSLVPLLAIAPYGAPQLDDFYYAKTAHEAWEATGSLGAVLSAAASFSALIYKTWQGTYAASFLMSLQPGLLNDAGNRFVPVILIGALLLGLWALVRSLGRHVLGLSVYERGLLFSLLAILCTQLLPSPMEGYYWYNGAMLYTFFFALLLLFFALLIAFYCRKPGKKRNIAYYILLPVLAALIAGGNYATGLLGALLLAVVVIWQFLGKNKRNVLPVVTLLILLSLFAANVLAPGNANRVLEDTGIIEALKAGIRSVIKGIRVTAQWSTLPVWVAAAAILPTAWRFAGRTDFQFRFPPLVMAASLLLLSVGFVPTFYTQDYAGPERLMDVQFYLHVLLLFMNVFYCTGWLRRHLPEEPFKRFSAGVQRGAVCLFAALALVVCIGSYDDFAAYRTMESLLSGEAAGYRAEYEARREILEDPAVSDAVLPPLQHLPELLVYGEYDRGEGHWANIRIAQYYGKDSVRVGDEEP